MLRIRFIPLEHVSEVLLCKAGQAKWKKNEIPIIFQSFASCSLLNLSVEAARIMAVDLLILGNPGMKDLLLTL